MHNTLLEKIQPAKFFASFKRQFDALMTNQAHVQAMFGGPTERTEFMLEHVLRRVIQNDRLHFQREAVMRNDLVAWDIVPVPFRDPGGQYDGAELNQHVYCLPLFMHVIIEHENDDDACKEFWKLLHLYAPLKVLVCYRPPSWYLKWFRQMREWACAFHPRSVDDAYLVIIGDKEAATPVDINWRCYELKARQNVWTELR